MQKNKGFALAYRRQNGFTLIELLVVIAIIGIVTAIVLASMSTPKSRAGDSSVKNNLRNAISQAQIVYDTRVASPNTYTNVCMNGVITGETTVRGIGAGVLSAAKASGLSTFAINGTGTGATATCNASATAWAAEVPLSGSTVASPKMWCVDSLGKNKQTTVSIGATTVCP